MKMDRFKAFFQELAEEPSGTPSSESKRRYFASRTISYPSPLGCLGIVAANQDNISHVFFMDDFPFNEPKHLLIQYPVLTRARELLDHYFAGNPLDVSEIPIQIDGGTPFQNSVWETIQQIPYGEFRSYKWIAEQIGKPKAVRAVGNAVGTNPVAILNPCHRVIRSNGALGGYGGGLDRKRQLLALEGQALEKLKSNTNLAQISR